MPNKTVVRLLSCVTAMLIGAEVFVAASPSEAGPVSIPVQQVTQLQIDVVTRENDLLKVTSNWPTSFTVENNSSKKISGFRLSIMADEDEGGPMVYVGWGLLPQGGQVQTDLLEPKEKVTVPIDPETVSLFERNGRLLLFVQQAFTWADNDFTTLYSFGHTLKRDPANPKQYNVVKKRHPKHHARPYLNHSIPLLRPLDVALIERKVVVM